MRKNAEGKSPCQGTEVVLNGVKERRILTAVKENMQFKPRRLLGSKAERVPVSRIKNAAALTGLILNKLDGTAKGGIVISIKEELQISVKFIGVGEKIDDMQPFCAEDFVNALFEGAEDFE